MITDTLSSQVISDSLERYTDQEHCHKHMDTTLLCSLLNELFSTTIHFARKLVEENRRHENKKKGIISPAGDIAAACVAAVVAAPEESYRILPWVPHCCFPAYCSPAEIIDWLSENRRTKATTKDFW